MGLVTYLRLRRIGLRNAWSLAGMSGYLASVLQFVAMVAVAVALWWFNAQSVEAATELHSAEITELRKIVAACVGEKFGTLKIGDEWFICGINSIGEMK